MALSMLSASTTAFSAPVRPVVSAPARATAARMGPMQDLEALATAQNPSLGYYDPLNLAQLNFWGTGEEGTIGFIRHAEIKHGRIAMAGFVGFIVQANGFKFPWEPFASITADTPQAQWDALPEVAKYQIILFIGFLEVFSEHSFILEAQGQKHYMKGGKPGFFPSLKKGFGVHPVPFDLWDPANAMSKLSEEDKKRKLNMEVNNGRLAMIGLMGFISEAQVPGSVPGLAGLVKPYAGDVMQPFATSIFPALP